MVRASSSHLHPNRPLLDFQLNSNSGGHVYATQSGASLPPPSFSDFGSTNPSLPSFASQRSLSIPPLRLAQPQDSTSSTRAQLHRQRLHEQYPTKLVNTRSIPGFRTSAAFFGSLRTNLRLHAAPLPPSPMSTPPSMRGSTTSLPPPSPLSGPVDSIMDAEPATPASPAPATAAAAVSTPNDPLADIPELKSYTATTEEDKLAALKLVADSVAQQRQMANQSLIYNPLNLSLAVAVLALVARYMRDSDYDWSIVGTTAAGFCMCLLAVFRWLTQDYLFAAEALNWDFLGDADDLVLVTKFGDEIIGALVLGWVSGDSKLKKQRKAWKGEIKAWTVRLKYRGKGVGGALLEDAVKEARKKGAEELEFADDHANSKRVLYDFYNTKFDKRERKSRELLQDLFEASPVRGKKK